MKICRAEKKVENETPLKLKASSQNLLILFSMFFFAFCQNPYQIFYQLTKMRYGISATFAS
jgi:hypothetical protein